MQYETEGRLRRIRDDSNDLLAEYSYDDLARRTLLTLGKDANDALLRKLIYGPGLDEPHLTWFRACRKRRQMGQAWVSDGCGL